MVTFKKNGSYQAKFIDEKLENSSTIEEVILRSHRDVVVDENAPLEKKSRDKEILKRLLDIEKAIIEKARERKII